MMTDIVELLRDPANKVNGWNLMLHADAADEIERLRAEIARKDEALKKIAQHDMQAIAMDALQPGERTRSPISEAPHL